MYSEPRNSSSGSLSDDVKVALASIMYILWYGSSGVIDTAESWLSGIMNTVELTLSSVVDTTESTNLNV
jgi:hypothetical protein